MSHRHPMVLCLLWGLLAGSPAGAAGYFTDLSALDGSYTSGVPTSVNSSGAVTGEAYGTKVFLYTGGSAGMIYNIAGSNFGSYASQGNAIDNTGGIAAGGIPPFNGYLYSGGTNGTSTTLAFPGESGANGATCINANGDVVGFAQNAAGTEAAFLYSGGTMYDLGGLGYGRAYAAIGMNNNGYAAGFASYPGIGSPPPLPVSHAVVWSYSLTAGVLTSTPTDINQYVSGSGSSGSSVAYAINDSNYVVGQSNVGSVGPNSTEPTYYYHLGDATAASMGALEFALPAGAIYLNQSGEGCAQLINDAGQVAGEFNSGGGVMHAAIWDSVHGLEDLNTLYAAALPAGFVLNAATAINNEGYIAGDGTDAAANTKQMFLLDPLVPGDANADGKVDINDLTIVLARYGQTGMTWNTGDFNGDGKVDINDLTIVLANYGKSLGASGVGLAAVPEPSALVLIGFGIFSLVACTCRRRR